MAQIHLVICYDTESDSVEVDWATTQAKFHEMLVFHPDTGQWDTPSGEEDELVNILIQEVDAALSEVQLG